MKIIPAVVAAILTNAMLLIAQTTQYTFNGLTYTFPSSQGAIYSTLTNNGSGTLTWAAGLPAGVVTFTKNGSCPTGWQEYTAARGRYIVGLPLSGTNLAAVGTALTTAENRATGTHSHTGSIGTSFSDPTHTHTITEPTSGTGHLHGDMQNRGSPKNTDTGASSFYIGNTGSTGTSTTGVTINNGTTGITVSTISTTVDNAGSVAGTVAPYRQYMACEKL